MKFSMILATSKTAGSLSASYSLQGSMVLFWGTLGKLLIWKQKVQNNQVKFVKENGLQVELLCA